VLLAEVMRLVHALLDGRLGPTTRPSPYYAIPFLRTDFWPLAAAAGLGLAALAWLRPRR
jgi:hypothetical protein